MKEYLGNPKNTIEIIQKYEFMFQKKFGQNFLIDTHVLEKIINAAGVTKDDCVLEIGPGIGTMTQYLAENARQVVAVEIDRNLIPILGETLAAWDNVTIINEDILKVDIRELAAALKEAAGSRRARASSRSAALLHTKEQLGQLAHLLLDPERGGPEAMDRLIREGRLEEARKIQYAANDIIAQLCACHGNLYAVMKKVLEKREGLLLGSVRAPLSPISEADLPQIEKCAAMIDDAVRAIGA